jgi:hypothetical protein
MEQQETISFAQLVDWVEERLEPKEAATVAHAVTGGNAQIKDTVAWLRAFRRATEAIVLVAPPAPVHDALLDAFTSLRKTEPTKATPG